MNQKEKIFKYSLKKSIKVCRYAYLLKKKHDSVIENLYIPNSNYCYYLKLFFCSIYFNRWND